MDELTNRGWIMYGCSVSASAYVLETRISDHHAIGTSIDWNAKVNNSGCSSVREVICNKLVVQKCHEYDCSQFLEITCPLVLYQTLVTVFNTFYKACTYVAPVRNKRLKQPRIDKV